MRLKLTPIGVCYPEDGTLCIISDGANFQLAHYFEQSYDPRNGATTENVFVNRVTIGYGWVEDVTEWMDMKDLILHLKK